MSAVVLALTIVFEPMRRLFDFGPLHADDVGVAIASGLIVLCLMVVAESISGQRGPTVVDRPSATAGP